MEIISGSLRGNRNCSSLIGCDVPVTASEEWPFGMSKVIGQDQKQAGSARVHAGREAMISDSGLHVALPISMKSTNDRIELKKVGRPSDWTELNDRIDLKKVR
jgi:hypothetical protein